MSTSPPQTTQSTKRPLEDASSPSRATDQPDAKRPALDKVAKSDEEIEIVPHAEDGTASPSEQNGTEKTNGATTDEATAEQPQSIDGADLKADALTQGQSANTADETAWIHIRAVISSPEAATIIGKGGENVSNIRKMSGAKCTVSDYQKGAVERILTVSGVVDAAAKV
jgi:heterogeneous nuclear rnp K-like protein 2